MAAIVLNPVANPRPFADLEDRRIFEISDPTDCGRANVGQADV
jgi:hypothetical protein